MADDTRTRYMARAIGLFLLVFGIGIGLKASVLYLLIPAFFQDGALVFVTAAFGMALGAAMIAAHNRWSGGTAALVITLFSWVTFIRSAALLVAPTLVAAIATNVARTQILPLLFGVIAALIGAWLTYVGWFARDRATAA